MYHMHSVFFQAIVDTPPVAWQARDVVIWLASGAAKPGAVPGSCSSPVKPGCTRFLELNVAIARGMKVVRTFPVRVKVLQGKKRAEFMFGVGKGLHRSSSYQTYHEEDGRNVWYGLRGLQGVGGDEFPETVMKAFTAYHSSSHTRPSRGRPEQSGNTTYRPSCVNF